MTDTGVLVLNRLFQAIQITSVRRAFCLLYKGEVRAVAPDYTTYGWEDWKDIPPQGNDEFIATPGYRVRIPRVVLLLNFDRLPRHDVRFTRKNIFFRDPNRCQYCGGNFPPPTFTPNYLGTPLPAVESTSGILVSDLVPSHTPNAGVPTPASIMNLLKP